MTTGAIIGIGALIILPLAGILFAAMLEDMWPDRGPE